MKFPSGIVASCNTTYGAEMPGFFRVHGSKGIIHMEPAFAYQGLHLKAEIRGEPPIDEAIHEKDPYQFVLEADDFAESILQNKEPKANGQEGLRDMQWMAEIYKSAGIKLA
jgi:predicted dehydrogenase